MQVSRNRVMNRWRNGWARRHADSQDRPTRDRYKGRLATRQTDKQTDRQTDRQRQAHRKL